jgi:nucleotide-binding universal stress UspA family protein
MSSFDRILLCYDATPEGQAALRCGAMLAKELRADTHLVAIFNCAHWTRGFDILSSVVFDVDETAARDVLQKGIERLREWDIPATEHLVTGNPADEIPRLANSLKVNLIVIGHHHENFLSHWWGGENQARLLEHVSCDVLFKSADSERHSEILPPRTTEALASESTLTMPLTMSQSDHFLHCG